MKLSIIKQGVQKQNVMEQNGMKLDSMKPAVMKADSAVSTVVGTVLLLVIVVLVAGLCAAAVFSSTDNGKSDAPVVFFSVSADDNALYHAGGKALSCDDIRVYSGDKDITDRTRIDGKRWTVWKTGDLLTFGKYQRESVTIVYKNGEILY